ncbi:MAG: tetraacyldisaccharide 4'-kinase, partial [Elusimicrobiota bacterium]
MKINPLYLLSSIYRVLLAVRAAAFKSGIAKTYRLDTKVICIGNLTLGGTGKSVTVETAVRYCNKIGKRAVILSRGYGRKNSLPDKRKGVDGILTISDGDKVFFDDPAECGDEPLMLARKLAGVPIIVCADRVKAGRFIIEKFNPDVIILDDGYQHLRLYRDLNVLCIDSTKWLEDENLFPAGTLREN